MVIKKEFEELYYKLGSKIIELEEMTKKAEKLEKALKIAADKMFKLNDCPIDSGIECQNNGHWNEDECEVWNNGKGNDCWFTYFLKQAEQEYKK